MVQDIAELRDALLAAELPLPLPLSGEAAATRDEAVAQIEDYLLPRLAQVDAPLLAVLGGSTGSGKSTLTNSLVGQEVSPSGVLRPTTRQPVLIHHPSDVAWFAGDGVLPDVPRSTGERGTGYGLHLVSSSSLTPGLGLLDSPDIDSVEVANHELATQLLGAADLWLFVTTAARYADAVPWQYLARASERAAAMALIINRIPPTPDGSARQDITADVRRMLDENGLQHAELFAIEETPLTEGRLGAAVDPVRDWILRLVADAEARADVIRRTVDGAVASLRPRTERVLVAMDEQRLAAASLEETSWVHSRAATRQVATQLGSGVLLRGEVLDRFREQVGTAEWMDRLQRGVGQLRDRLASWITGEQPEVEAAKGKLRDNLVGLIDDAIATSIEQTMQDWTMMPGGRTLLDVGTQDLMGAAQVDRIEESVAQWQDEVVAMVRERAGSKLAMARGLSLGVNGVGVTLMMALFASTGGLTGGEVAIAGGSAAVSQALLSAVLGEQAVRDLAASARHALLDRVETLTGQQHALLLDRLDQLPGDAQIETLQDAIDKVTT